MSAANSTRLVKVDLYVHQVQGGGRPKAWCVFPGRDGCAYSRYGKWLNDDRSGGRLAQSSRLKHVRCRADAKNLAFKKVEKGYHFRGVAFLDPDTGDITWPSAHSESAPAQDPAPEKAVAQTIDPARASRLQGQRNPRVMRLPR